MKRETSTILLVVITTVIIGVASYTQSANACIDAKFIWEPYTPSVGDTVTYNASISTCNWNFTSEEYIPIVSYEWDFGDGNITTITTPIVTHVYTEQGTYNVTLTITDAGGDPPSDTWTIPLTVKASSTVDGDSDGFPWWIAVVVVAAGIGIALPVYFRKARKPT